MATLKPEKIFPKYHSGHRLYESLTVSKEKLEVRHNGVFPGTLLGGAVPVQARFPGSIVTLIRDPRIVEAGASYYYDPEMRIFYHYSHSDAVWAFIWSDFGDGYKWEEFQTGRIVGV